VVHVLDAVRGYLQLATGLTEVTMRKAREVAQALLSGELDGVVPGKDAASDAARNVGIQVQDLADDIVAQANANRELLVGLIRTEVDRAAGRLGFVREEELAAVRRHVQRLEDQVSGLRSDLGGSRAPRTAAKKTAAKTAKKAVKKKVPAGSRTTTPAATTPAATAPAAEPVAPTDEGTT
jgi:hypothetical protein